MNRRPAALSIFASLSLAIAVQAAARAGSIEVVPADKGTAATMSGRLQTGNLGMMKLNKGTVLLKGSTVEVGAVPDWLFDRHTVLKGTLLATPAAGGQKTSGLAGLVYFDRGEWLDNLDNSKRQDNLRLKDGSILAGRIRSVNDSTVDFQDSLGKTRRIEKSDIDTVESPRAFYFEIPAENVKIDPASGKIDADATVINFTATTALKKRGMFASKVPTEPRSQLAGTEGGVTKPALAGMLFMDVVNTIAPAIVAPIVIPLSTQSAQRGIDDFNNNDAALSRQGEVVIP
ncbi:MAG: hypothetical protein IPM23_05000 [Candidatus Melainabacteria bacterium]|nr:hypothetical protein [Candidatus Melainabacteria bacterium]